MTTEEMRRLDAWIAEHVFGWKGGPRYSTDPAAAMEVLKRLAEKCSKDGVEPTIQIRKACDFYYVECDDSWVMVYENAPTLELAICLFAQKLFQ